MKKTVTHWLIFDINGERIYPGDTVEQVKPKDVQVEGEIFENFTWVLDDSEHPQFKFPDGNGACSIAFAAPFKLVKRGTEL